MKHMAFRIDETERARLEKTAEALHVSVSDIVRRAVAAFAQLDAGTLDVLDVMRERFQPIPEKVIIASFITDALARIIAKESTYGPATLELPEARAGAYGVFAGKSLLDRLVKLHFFEFRTQRRREFLEKKDREGLTDVEAGHLREIERWLEENKEIATRLS